MPTIARKGAAQALNWPVQRLPTGVQSGVRASDLAIPVGWALLRAEDDPALSVVCEIGERMPTPTQGYGGVEEVDRRGRTALTSWRGFKPFGIDLDLVFDGTERGVSVEPAIDVLEALAGRGRRATGGQPPRVIVNTAGLMPHDLTNAPTVRWWVNDLEWSDDEEEVETNASGDRVLASVTVSLLQHVTDRRLADRALAVRTRLDRQKGGAKRTHVAKEGENLMTIARDRLGDPGRWTEIAALNDIRDPYAVRQGAKIRLP